MSVGAWEPEQPTTAKAEIDREQLQRFISAVESGKSLHDALAAEDRSASQLIRLPVQHWLDESEAWQESEIWQLIRFFTLAEAQLPGWDAGAESAVIPLAKALRRRQQPLNKEQLLWIRQNSDNRYLPYGPL
ncbi:hypothetical protein AWR36_012685 [Microbulbifer flavimaris]|uniref:Uncharacterized protein n=1 Tax=Microbulbifer flavimaris TaxID=1781068 RepID=A0ABX4HXJ1_9GAMM|nr:MULTISPECIES: hypothetical protein [Microbulbifer]KUJ82633.1 hypothetical protein AVO43_12650 [Microbulbifer sp. ZGT114]PCO04844.1 hypothetical protein AWR36_012685 [Microbulbifer flavimaris]